MTGPKDKAKKPSKNLPNEDALVWEAAKETIEPLKRKKPRIHRVQEAAEPGPPAPKSKPQPATRTAKSLADLARSVAPRKTQPKPAPLFAGFDRKQAKKVRAGRVEIQARLDLHGLRQDAAHAALRRFLLSCHDNDKRLVLVITGKGAPLMSGHDDHFSGAQGPERGVLKRNVPRWLAEPELRAIVVSFTAAAISHGGDGALYIHLRSKRRG